MERLMGVEYYVVCKDCKEYIDIHKCESFTNSMSGELPPSPKDEPGRLSGSWWEKRGVWFTWRHRRHDIELRSDHDDDWFNDKPYLKEVWPSNSYFKNS